MDITAYNITYIISNLFTVYIVKLFMDKYLEIEPKYKKTVYAAYGGFFVITTLLYFLFDIPDNNVGNEYTVLFCNFSFL